MRILLTCLMVVFLFQACVTQTKTRKIVKLETGEKSRTSVVPDTKRMMDDQEKDLKKMLTSSDAVEIRRESDILALTLKGTAVFDMNSTTLTPGMQEEIKRIAGIMKKYRRTKIRTEGHTDNVGAKAYNMKLSKRRAEAVKKLLVQNGVNAGRISVMAFGDRMPRMSNKTDEGRKKNRRIEIRIEPAG